MLTWNKLERRGANYRAAIVGTMAAAGLSLFAAAHADAANIAYQIQRDAYYTQNSTAAPTTDYYLWGVDATSAFDSGTITYPGSGSPITLNVSGSDMSYYSSFYSTLSDLNAAYPTGDYTLTVHDSTNANPDENRVITYATDAYTNVPALTAPTYSGLSGMDPSQAYTLNFSPLSIGPDADSNTGSIALALGPVNTFLPASASSYVIPANTMSPDTSYTIFLSFGDDISDSSVDGASFTSFYSSTSIAFTTGSAVPEPATLGIALAGLGLLLSKPGKYRRHRRGNI